MLGAGTSGDRGELRPPAPHARPRTDVTRHGTSVLRVRAPAPGTTCVLSGGAACGDARVDRIGADAGRRRAPPTRRDSIVFLSVKCTIIYSHKPCANEPLLYIAKVITSRRCTHLRQCRLTMTCPPSSISPAGHRTNNGAHGEIHSMHTYDF